MKKNLLFTSRNWFYRIMFLFVLVCTSAMSQAADPVDLGILELDKEYTMEANKKGYIATFTVPKTGILTCSGQMANHFRAYENAEHDGQTLGEWDFASQTMTISVTEGQVLYFNEPWGWYSGTFKLTMPGEEGIILEMREASPADGSVAPTAAGGLVEVFFNVPVISTAAADLTIGSIKIGSVTPRIGGTVVSIEMASYLLTAYDRGLVKEGDELTITFHVAAKNDTNVKGDYTVTYRCPAQIVHLKNATHIPAAFLSYWVTGDMDGVLRLEFTGELNTAGGNAVLGYGDLESETGDYYTETIPYTVEGNVLSLDLTGKLRTPNNMVPSGTNYGIMSLQVKGIKDKDGNFVYSEGQGTIGSYAYSFDYKLLSFDIDHEFYPAEGASLANEKEVEIWIRGEEHLIYNGVKFTYVEDGTTKEVVVTNVNREELAGEVTLTVAIPEEVKGKTNIEVSLNELQCKDGQDHQISARYDAFVITVNQPRENTMEVLTEGTIFNVSVNSELVGYMEYEIHDLNPTNPDDAIIKSYSWLTKQDNGSWEAEVYGDYKLIKGHDYAVIFTAWTSEEAQRNGESPVGTDRYIIHGATLPYMNSDLTLVSMTPSVEAGFASEDDNVITLEFDGLVMLSAETTFINVGSGMEMPFEAIEAVDPQDGGYANTWKLTVPKSAFAGLHGELSISFVATDMNDRRLNGNENRTGEDAYFYYGIPCTFAIPDFTVVPANDAELKSLSQITVGYEEGINTSWDGSKVEVYSMTRDLVATVVEETQIIPEEEKDNWNYQPKEMVLTLDKTIDQNGSYYIKFPAGHFYLGSETNSYNSKLTTVDFTINNPVEPQGTTIAITDRGNGLLVLEFAEGAEPAPNWECKEKILVKNAGGNVVLELTDNNIEIDWDLPVNFLLLNGVNITEPGEYTIEFPAGFFLTDAMGTVPSTAVTVKYVVEGEKEEFITVVTPTETTLEKLNKGDLITITVADENVGYVEYEIHDLNPVDPDLAIIKTYASMPKQADGSFQAKIYGAGYKLIEGHDYAVIFTAYAAESDKRSGIDPIGTHTHILHGATPAYVNSDLTLVSITPDEETGFASEDDNVVTVEFSGLVKLESSTTYINLGFGSTQAFESIEAVEPTEEGLATTWKLTVPKSMFVNNSAVEFAIVATDAEGRRLNGNDGRTGETAYFYYSMPCSFAIPDFTVVPSDNEELKSLSEITVGYNGGINVSWDGSKIKVYTLSRELVATVVEETQIIPEEEKDNMNYQAKEMVLTLDNTIDQNGAYYILFPAGHFNLGSQFEGFNSKQTIVNFTINNPVEPQETTIAVTDNGDGRLLLTFDEGTSVNTNSACEEKVVVKNAEGNVVCELGSNAFEFGIEWNEMIMNPNGQLDVPGEYTIEFPAGFFVTDETGTVESTAVTVKYVVEGEEPQIATYYLKNVESGLYLTAGNSWGTQASLGAHGLDLVITQLENGKYTIDTNLANGDKHYLGNGFMDAALTEWTISEVEEGVYNITLDGTNYIGYDGETTVVAFNLTDATAAAAQWTLVTKEDLLAEMAVATEENPADATFLITGQGFNRNDTNRNNAWEGTPALGGDNTNFCAEKFNTTFDVYQTLTNVPNGYYIVTVQGFYRNGGFAEAAAAHNAGTEALNAVLYANNESTPIMSIFAESKEAAEGGWGTETEAGYIPNNMANASNVFTAGAYATNKLLVCVEDGTLTIGVKKEAVTENDWTIFDNFELSYLGKECVAIDGVNADGTGINADNFAVYTLTGVLVKAEANKADLKNLPAGIYIVNGKKYLVK